MRRTLLVLVGAALAGHLAALSTATGPLGLGAAAMGAAGAVVATAEGTTALDWNPAGLGSPGWNLAYDFGQGGPTGSVQQGLALAGTLDPTLGLGLRLDDQDFGPYQEGGGGLGVAIQVGPWLSLGTVQKLLLAGPGGLRGWSMDLGAGVNLPLAGGWRLRLGAAASDLASSLAWANGLEEVQPAVTRLGAALQPAPGTWLAVEQDHLDRQGNGGVDQWRAGAQLGLWGQRLALRAGATEAAGAGLYATAGLGLRLPWPSGGAALDYAVLLPAQPGAASALRQLASLTWSFGLPRPSPPVQAQLAQALTDRRGRLRLARIALTGLPADAKAWRVEVKDKAGRTVKVFAGRGPAPEGLVWDGRDSQGQPVRTDGLSYELRGSSAGGISFHRRALLAPTVVGGLGAALAGTGEPTWGLRPAAPIAQPTVKLKGDNELAVSSADFNVEAVAGNDTKGWELRIVDAGGKTVKTIRGQGRPPKDVRWEGNDDLGRPLQGSLGASYEIRVIDAAGHERVAAAAPVVASAGFAALAAQAQARVDALPACGCQQDPSTGGLHCVLYFTPGEAWLSVQADETLARALNQAGRRSLHGVQVVGYASPGGAAAHLAQARADEVLRRLVDKGRLELKDATVEGRVQAGRPGRVELDLGSAP